MTQVDRTILQVKRGFPWVSVLTTTGFALFGGVALGFGYKLVEYQSVRPPQIEEAVLAQEPVEIGPVGADRQKPTRAGEYAKFKAVGETLNRCASTLRRTDYASAAKIYRESNEARADAVRDDYYTQISNRYAEAREKTEKLAGRGRTKLGVVGMIADGSMAEMSQSMASLTSEMSGAMGDEGLIGSPNVEACDAFARKVSYGEYDLAYF